MRLLGAVLHSRNRLDQITSEQLLQYIFFCNCLPVRGEKKSWYDKTLYLGFDPQLSAAGWRWLFTKFHISQHEIKRDEQSKGNTVVNNLRCAMCFNVDGHKCKPKYVRTEKQPACKGHFKLICKYLVLSYPVDGYNNAFQQVSIWLFW